MLHVVHIKLHFLLIVFYVALSKRISSRISDRVLKGGSMRVSKGVSDRVFEGVCEGVSKMVFLGRFLVGSGRHERKRNCRDS